MVAVVHNPQLDKDMGSGKLIEMQRGNMRANCSWTTATLTYDGNPGSASGARSHFIALT